MEKTVTPRPVEPQKLSAQAREAIRARIISGEFPMGERLTESELARLLGVSKSPVREALLQLEREGLIVLAANRTTHVFSMDGAEITELGELRAILEAQALRLAFERNPQALTHSLATIADHMGQALARGDTDAYKLLDHDFHGAIFEHCGNGYLARNFRMLSFRIQALRNRLSSDPALNARSLQEHQRIRDAIRERSLEGAADILAGHISQTTQSYLARIASVHDQPQPELRTVRVNPDEMDRFARAALDAAGADTETVAAVTKALTHASLLGVDTHGFRLLPHYLRALDGGRVKGAPNLEVVGGTGAACILDAGDGHGARAGYRAVEIAVDRARQYGLGAVAIRNSSHFGAAGAYAFEIAEQGMMGLAFCNSDAFVRLHGGAARFHGTNPIAAAAPAENGPPWLLDMATSSIPFNRVLLSQSVGIPLPENVASDAEGVNITDPHMVEMLAPLGGALFGYKGAGLAGLAEILSSAFADAPLSAELLPMVAEDMSTPRGLGAFVMALDPDAFAGAGTFRAVISRYLAAIRASSTAAGQTVMAPGDREWKEAELRRRNGLKIDATTIASLQAFAKDRGLQALRTRADDRSHH